jgi:hypothetical protein
MPLAASAPHGATGATEDGTCTMDSEAFFAFFINKKEYQTHLIFLT